MRWAAVGIWSVVMLVGTALILWLAHPPQDKAEFKAARKMAAGTLLQPGDIKPNDDGRYLRHDVTEGQVLHSDDLGDFPTLAREPGEIPVALALPLAKVQSATLKLGGKVALCAKGKPAAVLDNIMVRAVLCGTDAPCIAILGVPSDKAATLATGLSGADTPTLETAGGKCP